MTEYQLLSIFFLLGKSPKDWDFLEDDWEYEYQASTNLSWTEFMELQEQGWWKYHSELRSLFTVSFSRIPDFEIVQNVYESIFADSEDWNDFFDLLLDGEEFESIWTDSWLTRDDMASSLSTLWESDKNASSAVDGFHDVLQQWYESDQFGIFREELIKMLKPLETAISEISTR